MQPEENERIKEDEIDLIALIQTLWKGRRTILKFIVVFGLIGLFIALFSPKEYTAKTIMAPEFSENKIGGSLGGLAAMTGINLQGASPADVVPPSLYPMIINSSLFKRELAKTPLKVADVEGEVTFTEYYTNIYNPGVLSWLKKYTLGLPGVIFNSFRGTEDKKVVNTEKQSLVFLSKEEQQIHEILTQAITIEINSKDGYIELVGHMPEAIPAAQLTQKAQKLLQNYIIDFRSKKAVDQLKFMEERYDEKEKEFREAELNLARFQDQNKNVISAQAATKERRLQSDYNLTYSIYSELARQIEQQKIQVKENTPVFTIIEPVSVPVEKSKPKRSLILFVWVFLGGVLGVGIVFGRNFLGNIKNREFKI